MIKNIFLLLLTIILLFFLFEISLRLFKPQIFDIHPQGMYITNDKVGYLLNPDFKGSIEREEFSQPFIVNKKGLRGREPGLKSINTFRIFILGDSYSFGFGVKENETFGAYLEGCLTKKLKKKVEVINGGIPGYGTVDELNLLKLYGKEFEPDLVILQFLTVNDFEENNSPAVEWADVKDGWLRVKDDNSDTNSTEYFSFGGIYSWLKLNSHSIKFLSERMGYMAMKYGILNKMDNFWGEDFSKDDEKITGNAVHEFIQYTKVLNADLLLLYTVGQGQVLAKDQDQLQSEKFIAKIMERENIKWINTLREMRKLSYKDELYFPIDGHWTSSGHRAIAEMICGKLTADHSINIK